MKKNYILLSVLATMLLFVIAIYSCTKSTPDTSDNNQNNNQNNNATTGEATFWIASNINGITVTCEGQSKTITAYYGSGAPNCGATGCATFDLTPGTHSFTATNGSLNWNGSVTVTAGGCFKEELQGSSGGGGGGNNNSGSGQATFWIASNIYGITVTCGGQSKTITSYYSSGAPNCGATGCATFDLAPGTYPFTATNGSSNWSGSVTVTANGCFKEQLTGGSNSNNNNNNGGDNNTNYNVTFWTAATKYGQIQIYVNNTLKGTITSSYTSAPGCGAAGCVTVSIPAGTNNTWYAKAGNYTWNSTSFTLTTSCTRIQLY